MGRKKTKNASESAAELRRGPDRVCVQRCGNASPPSARHLLDTAGVTWVPHPRNRLVFLSCCVFFFCYCVIFRLRKVLPNARPHHRCTLQRPPVRQTGKNKSERVCVRVRDAFQCTSSPLHP